MTGNSDNNGADAGHSSHPVQHGPQGGSPSRNSGRRDSLAQVAEGKREPEVFREKDELPADNEKEFVPSSVDRDLEASRAPTGSALQQHLSRRSEASRHDAADYVPELQPGSRMSTDPEGNTYPESGRDAYLVVFGSFCGLFGSLGLVNTMGTFQAWLSTHQLKDYGQNSISWIFGVYAFLIFFGGVQIGPMFDTKGPRYLMLVGTVMVVLSTLLLGWCHEYWHFMLDFGVLQGIGVSLVFTPCVASPGHWFYRLRGRATGLAATGGSVGGVVFPLMLQKLFPKIGFAWATRALTLISLVSMVTACLLVRSRLPKKKATKENILPDLRIFREPLFTLTALGIFFVEWGLFIPITFISSYALDHGMSQSIAYGMLAILNAGSFFGRWIPGFTADYLGRFNTMIITVVLALVSTACLWLLSGSSVALLVLYALIFGFASGSNISLTPVCVGQVCKTEHYGRYYATSYTVVSFGTLTGTPIAGQILTLNGGDYWGLIAFTSACYFAGLICFVGAKVVRHGWRKPFIIY